MTKQSAEADKQFSYEIGYLVDSTLSPESAEKAAATITSLVEKAGGTVKEEGKPVLRQLAYEIVKGTTGKRHKHKAGYFGWMIFTLESSEVPGLKTKLDGHDEIIRFLLIKKDRETVIMTPQELKEETPEGEEVKTDEKTEDSADAAEKPSSKEEIDQKIDSLVIS